MLRILPFLLIVTVASFGQKIENVKAEVQGGVITLTFDLSAANPTDTYNISISSSANDFRTTLSRVSGDVGKGITPGAGKKVVWQAQSELGTFKGVLSFELQGEVVAGLAFSPPPTSAKRGSNKMITWRGGDRRQDVRVELLKDGAIAASLATVSNNGSYTWSIPSNQKPGTYELRLINGKETTSHPFVIKHKVPTLVKILPIVAAGGAAAALAGGGGKGGGPTHESAALPEPPGDVID